MKIICPIRPKNFDDFLSLIKKIDNRANIVEIWLDQVKDVDIFLENFKKFKKQNTTSIKFLSVCKQPEENGRFKGSDIDRIKILNQFIDASGDFVDVDITRNSESEIKKITPENLILSFHDFEKMPKSLNDIFDKMKKHNPTIYKFAVTTETKDDLKDFLNFIEDFPKEEKAIFTTMGKYGQLGREEIGKNSWGQFFALDKDSVTASVC